VCQEATAGNIFLLHAVNKMVEASCKVEPPLSLYRQRKQPPKGALVKSHGIERLGKVVPRVRSGMGIGVECK